LGSDDDDIFPTNLAASDGDFEADVTWATEFILVAISNMSM
jgi:hypothetical protein